MVQEIEGRKSNVRSGMRSSAESGLFAPEMVETFGVVVSGAVGESLKRSSSRDSADVAGVLDVTEAEAGAEGGVETGRGTFLSAATDSLLRLGLGSGNPSFLTLAFEAADGMEVETGISVVRGLVTVEASLKGTVRRRFRGVPSEFKERSSKTLDLNISFWSNG